MLKLRSHVSVLISCTTNMDDDDASSSDVHVVERAAPTIEISVSDNQTCDEAQCPINMCVCMCVCCG